MIVIKGLQRGEIDVGISLQPMRRLALLQMAGVQVREREARGYFTALVVVRFLFLLALQGQMARAERVALRSLCFCATWVCCGRIARQARFFFTVQDKYK